MKNLGDLAGGAPLYVQLQLGEHRLRANVKNTSGKSSGSNERPEAVVFTQKHLADLYKENLVFTLINKESKAVLGSNSLPVKKLMIGKKFDAFFDLAPGPEATTHRKTAPMQVRLAVELMGPLRREFRFLSDVVGKYYSTVDRTVDGVASAGHSVQPYVMSKWSLPLLVPFGLLLVLASPFMGVALTIGLPVFFPLFLLGCVGGLTILIASIILALSSRTGRHHVEAVVDPFVRKLTHTSTGQQLLYETGARPSFMKVAKTFAPKGKWERLVVSLVLDAIGSSSYLLPILGELTDLAWAPMFAVMVAAMYSETSPYMHYVGLVEELLPFTDIIPTATLAWLRENGAVLAKDFHAGVLSGQRRAGAATVGAGSASHTRM